MHFLYYSLFASWLRGHLRRKLSTIPPCTHNKSQLCPRQVFSLVKITVLRCPDGHFVFGSHVSLSLSLSSFSMVGRKCTDPLCIPHAPTHAIFVCIARGRGKWGEMIDCVCVCDSGMSSFPPSLPWGCVAQKTHSHMWCPDHQPPVFGIAHVTKQKQIALKSCIFD